MPKKPPENVIAYGIRGPAKRRGILRRFVRRGDKLVEVEQVVRETR
jgi:hypothetical protein